MQEMRVAETDAQLIKVAMTTAGESQMRDMNCPQPHHLGQAR